VGWGYVWGAGGRRHPGRLLPRCQSRWPSRDAIGSILGTSDGIKSGKHSHPWLKVSDVLHRGYDAVPSVSTYQDPAGTRWSRRDCDG